MREFLKRLKTFYGFVASASVLIPGLTFFLQYSPPLIGGLAILVSALSAAFVWMGFKSPSRAKNYYTAIKYMIGGFVLSIIYWVLLDLTSIRIESAIQEIRYQVGFDLANWSLESDAIKNIKSLNCPHDSKKSLFLCYTASNDNVYLIWKRWTVYLFGIINVITFTVSSVLWSYGWGKLIKTSK